MAFPNLGVNRQTFTWRDAKGNTANMHLYLSIGPGAATVVDLATLANGMQVALDPGTNAALQGAIGPIGETGVVQYGGTGAYQPVEQKAVFVFQDTAGKLHRYELPAPKVALFAADAQTILPTATLTAPIIAAFLATSNGAFFCGKDGEQLINFMGGYWRGRKLRRKTNVLVLTPLLTAALPAE